MLSIRQPIKVILFSIFAGTSRLRPPDRVWNGVTGCLKAPSGRNPEKMSLWVKTALEHAGSDVPHKCISLPPEG